MLPPPRDNPLLLSLAPLLAHLPYPTAHASPSTEFEAGASNWSTQFGCWGLVERITDTASSKLSAFDAARVAPRPANALGIPVPTIGFPAGYYSGCNAPNASSAGTLGMHGGDQRVLYPVNLAGVAPGAVLSVAIADSYSPNVLEVGLNGRALQNISIPGTVRFTLAQDDVSGTFRGVAALGLRAVTLGAYYIIDNITLTIG